jgi:hypothetical protein
LAENALASDNTRVCWRLPTERMKATGKKWKTKAQRLEHTRYIGDEN